MANGYQDYLQTQQDPSSHMWDLLFPQGTTYTSQQQQNVKDIWGQFMSGGYSDMPVWGSTDASGAYTDLGTEGMDLTDPSGYFQQTGGVGQHVQGLIDFLSGQVDPRGEWTTETRTGGAAPGSQEEYEVDVFKDTGGIGAENAQALFSQMFELMKGAPKQAGLQKKIGQLQQAGKQKVKSLAQAYTPQERQSRYGVLQGAQSAQAGEAQERAYEQDIYGVQQGIARGIESEQEQFASDYFQKLQDIIGGF